MRVAAGEELIERFGTPGAFAAAYDENRRALGPSYIDYVFTVSGAEHAISLALGAFVLTACDTLRPAAAIDLGSGATLRLGGGPHAGMDGELAAVRLYDRALEATEIISLAGRPPVA